MKKTIWIWLALLAATPAQASGPSSMNMQSYDDCANQKLGADARLEACNRALAFESVVGGKKPFWLYINRGTVYLAKRQYELAIQDFDKSISMTPWFGAYLDRGAAYARLGKYEDAIKDYDSAAALSNEPKIYVARGEAYLAMGQTDRGLQDLDQAIKIDPDNPGSYNSRCWTLAMAGIDLDKALDDCNRAAQLDSKNLSYLDSRAVLYFRMANYPLAITDANAILDADPKMASALYIRGVAKLKTGDVSGNRDLSDAKAFDPTVADTYAGYGVKP